MVRQTFKVREDYRIRLWTALAVGVSVLALCGAFLLWSGEANPDGGHLASLAGAGFLAMAVAAGVVGWGMLRRTPDRTVMADDDGVWTMDGAGAPRLTSWRAIHGVWHRPWLGRMELIDESGRSLASISLHLYQFGLLEEIICKRIPDPRIFDGVAFPTASAHLMDAAPRTYYSGGARYLGFLMRLLALGGIAAAANHFAGLPAAVGVLTIGGIFSYFRNRTVTSICMTTEALEVRTLWRILRYSPSDIEAVDVAEVYDGIWFPGMRILTFLAGGETGDIVATTLKVYGERWPIQLFDMGPYPEDLARRIRNWRLYGAPDWESDGGAQPPTPV